jgi:hypothetical protein
VESKRAAAIVLAVALTVPALLGAVKLFGPKPGEDAQALAARAEAAETLRDFVARLDAAGDQTYTAWYTTGAGQTIVSANEPPRHVYRSPVGQYVSGPEATYACRTPENERPACARTAGVDGVPLTHARALIELLQGSFAPPEVIASWLSRAATNPPGPVVRSEQVYAEQPGSCVAVAKVFTACATPTGVLTFFESPDAKLALTQFKTGAPAAEMFSLPKGAAVSDGEPG